MPLKKWTFPIALGAAALPLLGAYAYGVWREAVPLYPFALAYAGMSLITIAVYRHDKAAAVADEWRVKEHTLHALELFGGWPGALVAQHLLRHKVKKPSYQLVFWLIVVIHCAGWYAVKSEGAVPQALDLLPKNLTSHIPELPKLHVPQALQSFLKTKPAPQPAQPQTDPVLTADPTPSPGPRPEENGWTNAPAAEALITDPNVLRTRVIANRHSRKLRGAIKAVSPSLGLLVSLPPEMGADGVISPATLIGDFHRRFRIGERVEVAVNGISIKGGQKQITLLLVEATAARSQPSSTDIRKNGGKR